MRIFKYAFLLIFSGVLLGQATWEAGLSLGESDLLRNNSSSYYNYSNREYGTFLKFTKDWNHNAKAEWKKYWTLEGSVQLSDYEHLYLNEKSTVTRFAVLGGLSIKLPIQPLDLRIGGFFGPGYHTGYSERLPKGFVFSEGVSIRAARNDNHKLVPSLSVGYMHTSNGNIYDLNKGLEVLFVKFGWHLKTVPSK